jgi:hypothetical protein
VAKKTLPKDMKLPYEKEPPEMYCMECSLPKDITKKLRTVMCEDESDDEEVLERCKKCGFHNIKPPRACKMWGATVTCSYLARKEVALSEKSGIFEDKFAAHTSTFREAALKLRELLYEWLWHIWIKQSTAHWHKFKIETFDKNTVLIVWDYANRNPMIGPWKSTCERDPKMGCLVAVALFNPTECTQAESEAAGKPRAVMCDYWRNFSSAKDCAVWNKHMLCEMLVHYRGKQPVGQTPVADPAGGWGDPGVSRADLRAGLALPAGAVGRAISYGAVPNLDKLVIVSDGKSSTYKGGPNFGVMIDVREKFDLKEILLCYGATAHMSGPQDSIGKQPHTLATAWVNQGRIMSIYSAQEMYDFCVKQMPQPLWIVNKQPAPTGTMGGNSAYVWGFFNNGSSLVKSRLVKGIATVEGFNGGYDYDGVHGSSQAYSFSINRPIHPPKLDCHAVRPIRCREVEFRLLGGYCSACLEADKIGMGEWRGETGIVRKEDIACTCTDWTRSRRWTKHLKKTPIDDADRKKRCAVTAKRNALEQTQKAAAKKRKLKQGAWVADFSDVEEHDSSEDEEEEDEHDDNLMEEDDEEMDEDADNADDF